MVLDPEHKYNTESLQAKLDLDNSDENV